MGKATIDDVAELAGVSIKTVSRVVNNEPNVRESTREKVEMAVAQLNYRPNLSARNLASHRSHQVVLVYDDPSAYETPSSGYIIRMQKGTLKACKQANCDLLIHPCNYRDPDVKNELRTLIERSRPDGVVIAAPLSNMAPIVSAIAHNNTPYVRISPGTRKNGEFSVSTNDREVSAEMTRYLASLGHTRIAFISGHSKHQAVANRLKGYKDGLKQSGLSFDQDLVAAGDSSIASGVACAEELLELPAPPTAIFAANDDMAAGVIRVAYKHGIRIPEQLSVAGFDDSALARQIFPSLTTVRQPLNEMAETAALTLIGHSGAEIKRSGALTIPGELRIRESTGPAPE
jgi:LacI family transcriptional regulator